MASKSAFPPGSSWFESLKKSFADVPVDTANDNAISTSEFLEAAESLASLFDVLGSVAFTPVKNDILGNVKSKKVRDRQLTAPADSESLQSLVVNELKTKKHTATEGLLWLTRYSLMSLDPCILRPLFELTRVPQPSSSGLDFTSTALRHNQSNPQTELSDSFRAAYGTTLKPHHSFLVKPVFSAAMSATPYRKDFYAKLASDQSKLETDREKWLEALERQVKILNGFTARKEAKW
ncbi:MAG: hypothetical protein Q9190_001893 [Brigantiaea leucoxantha]